MEPKKAVFKIGDIVQLKSGGPLMTVQKVRTDEVDCMWFDGSTLIKNTSFPLDTLVQPKPAKSAKG